MTSQIDTSGTFYECSNACLQVLTVFKLSATLQRIKKCNPFQANFLFLYPLKHQKTPGFLTFSVGIEI